MDVEFFLALSRNVGKLREMKKAHEDMATDITVLKLENSELRRKLSSPLPFAVFFESSLMCMLNFG